MVKIKINNENYGNKDIKQKKYKYNLKLKIVTNNTRI